MSERVPSVLVTGAAGFLGLHTVERFIDRGFLVRALDIPDNTCVQRLSRFSDDDRVRIVHRDLFDIDPESEIFDGLHAIIHCAGIADHRASFDFPEHYIRANVTSLARILDSARRNGGAKVINPSSSAVYGLPEWPTREDHPLAPVNPYGLSKLLAEQLATHWHRLYDLPTISFRIFNGYGPGTDTRHGLIGTFLQSKCQGETVVITGDGNQRRDFIHVFDIVEAFVCAAESDRAGEIYNLGSGTPASIITLAELMKLDVTFAPAESGGQDVTCADIAKIKNHFGWEPKISLAEGIKWILPETTEKPPSTTEAADAV